MKPAHTRALLIVSLVGTLALVWFVPTDADGVSSPAVGKRSHKATAERSKPAKAPDTPVALVDTTPEPLNNVERASQPKDIPDVFKGFSWYVPPPPPVPQPPPPPPAPSAPPLPFVYLGQYIEGGKSLIFLTRGDRVLSVSIGDTIDRIYQVQSMKGGQLTFLYLPLQTEQTINTGVPQ